MNGGRARFFHIHEWFQVDEVQFINSMTRQVITTSDGNCSAYTAIVINILEGLTTLTATLSHKVATLCGAGQKMLHLVFLESARRIFCAIYTRLQFILVLTKLI